MNNEYECLVIGCGPSGIGASIKLKEAGIKSAIIERSMPGGKVNICPRVDNYPGFTKIPGPELAMEFFKKVKSNDIELIQDEVIELTKNDDKFIVRCNKETYVTKAVMVACGTKERKIGLPKEDELLGHGLSYCALCDWRFYADKDVLIIGGGNSALKDAIFLASKVNKLTLIHRRNEFRGLNHLVNELKNHENVEILTPYVPREILGKEKVVGVKIKNVETNEEKEIKIDGLFPLVGQIPNSNFVKIDGVLNEHGSIPVDSKTFQSNVKGLFAGGDILPREIKQIYLSEHDGMMAAKSIIEFLRN